MRATRLGSMMLVVHRALAARGLDASAIARKAEIDIDAIADANARVPDAAAIAFWRLAREAAGDDCFGLDVARQLHPTSLHALGYAWLASATLYDALRRLVRYGRLVTDVEQFALHDEGERVRLEMRLPGGRFYSTADAYDAALAIVIRLARTSAGESLRPLDVRVMREQPACAAQFESFFGAPVQFSAGEYSISFARADLQLRLPTANAELALAAEQVVQAYLARLGREDVLAAARRAIIHELPGGKATQKTVARALTLSPRTLHRRLAEQGATFKRLLDSTRRELAIDYLRTTRTVGEIAYLLGFSDVSNFSSAFKRWTGRAPSVFRAGEGVAVQ